MCAYAMRDSRGRKVPGGILGNRGGTIVRGGRGAYGPCHTRRCRAHTLREMRDLCARNPDDRDARHVTHMIERIFRDALAASETCASPGERKAARSGLIRRTRHIARRHGDDPAIGRFMGKPGRAAGNLSGFVLNPRIPPTNNIAERGLRKIVVHRKIRGAMRAAETMAWMGHLFTCVMTWKS